MAHMISQGDSMPVLASADEFDRQGGGALERFVFNNRPFLIFICALLTGVLGYFASGLNVTARFDAMMPQSHEFIKNYKDNAESLALCRFQWKLTSQQT